MFTKSNNECNNNDDKYKHSSNMNECIHNAIQNEPTNQTEFQLLIPKTNNSTRAPYASYYSSKELPTSIHELPYDIYEDEDTIPTPIKLIGRNYDEYRNSLKHGFIQSFVCSGERPLVKRHQNFYSSFKDSAFSVSSSHLELLRSVDNDSNSRKEILLHQKENAIQRKSPPKKRPLFKSTQMIYIKSKPKPCSLNINKKTHNVNSHNTPVQLDKTQPRFESIHTQTINLTCNTNLNRSIEEINSNSFIIIDDNDNNINLNKNTNYNNPIKNNKLCSIQSPFNNLHINTDQIQLQLQQQFLTKNDDSSFISITKEEKNLFATPSQLRSTSRTTTKNNSEATSIFKRKSQIMKSIEQTNINKDKLIDIKVKELRKKAKNNASMKTNATKIKYITKRNGNKNDLLPASAKPKMRIHPSSYHYIVNNNKIITSSRLRYPIKFDNENFSTCNNINKCKNNKNIYDDNIFLKKHSNIYHALNK